MMPFMHPPNRASMHDSMYPVEAKIFHNVKENEFYEER
jgi:hypothetical protein